jgi:phage shock protein A
MSLMKRISLIFRSKANKALDRAEDPRETLDYSYQRQLDLLSKVRRGVADVATSRKRVELQVTQLEGSASTDLKAQHAQLLGEEEKLTLAQQRLQAKVESFRTRKETIKATYTAAEAQTRINEAMSGIGEEMGDVGLAIQRAEDKTAQMQARAGAIDELLASGALDDPTGTAKDDITLELEQLASTSDVESELARMKASLSAGPSAAPQAIEGEQVPSQQPPTQAAPPPSLDAQAPPEFQAPPSQGQEAPPAQPQGDLR